MNKTHEVVTKPCGCRWRVWLFGREQISPCCPAHLHIRTSKSWGGKAA